MYLYELAKGDKGLLDPYARSVVNHNLNNQGGPRTDWDRRVWEGSARWMLD